MIHALSAHEVCMYVLIAYATVIPPTSSTTAISKVISPLYPSLASNPTNPFYRQFLKHSAASSPNSWLPTIPLWLGLFAQIASLKQLIHLLPPWSTSSTIQAGASLTLQARALPKPRGKERRPNGIDSNKAREVVMLLSNRERTAQAPAMVTMMMVIWRWTHE
jgi:hypothetical protein